VAVALKGGLGVAQGEADPVGETESLVLELLVPNVVALAAPVAVDPAELDADKEVFAVRVKDGEEVGDNEGPPLVLLRGEELGEVVLLALTVATVIVAVAEVAGDCEALAVAALDCVTEGERVSVLETVAETLPWVLLVGAKETVGAPVAVARAVPVGGVVGDSELLALRENAAVKDAEAEGHTVALAPQPGLEVAEGVAFRLSEEVAVDVPCPVADTDRDMLGEVVAVPQAEEEEVCVAELVAQCVLLAVVVGHNVEEGVLLAVVDMLAVEVGHVLEECEGVAEED